jgi:hypothetical protein
MSGFWLVSYIILWLIVLVGVGLLAGVLRELGLGTIQARTLRTNNPLRAPRIENVGPDIGAPFRDLRGLARTGNAWVESQYVTEEGIGSLLLFMSPNCRSCQDIVEPLNHIADERSRDLRVAVVLKGNEKMCRNFIDLFKLRAQTFLDEGGGISRDFRVNTSPFGLYYGPEGTLVRKGVVTDEVYIRVLIGEDVTAEDANAWVFPAMEAGLTS